MGTRSLHSKCAVDTVDVTRSLHAPNEFLCSGLVPGRVFSTVVGMDSRAANTSAVVLSLPSSMHDGDMLAGKFGLQHHCHSTALFSRLSKYNHMCLHGGTLHIDDTIGAHEETQVKNSVQHASSIEK